MDDTHDSELQPETKKLFVAAREKMITVDSDVWDWAKDHKWEEHRGYIFTRIPDGKGGFFHKRLARMIMKPPKGLVVYCKDGSGYNLVRSNLALCTRGERFKMANAN